MSNSKKGFMPYANESDTFTIGDELTIDQIKYPYQVQLNSQKINRDYNTLMSLNASLMQRLKS